jgi:hypothetical protein
MSFLNEEGSLDPISDETHINSLLSTSKPAELRIE